MEGLPRVRDVAQLLNYFTQRVGSPTDELFFIPCLMISQKLVSCQYEPIFLIYYFILLTSLPGNVLKSQGEVTS